jgi:hypothetical protein
MAEGYFWQSDPNVNSQLRQRIALAMLSAKKGYPTTLGQGLTAIGDAIGDLGLMRRLEKADVAQQAAAMGVPAPPGGPQADAAGTPADFTRAPPDYPTRAETPQRPDTPIVTPPQTTMRSLGPPGQTAQSAGAGAAGPSPGPSAPSSEEAGGYNVIDAQAGTKMAQAPGYVRDAIARATSDPDMQAYLGNLAAKEGPRPGMVSKSGAAGPFQFVPGTARQYGLSDPNNPDASTQAALQLTTDNAAQFQKINGRPPTMAELAVMHQQGGGTGARMVAGTGNAPPRNLLLNNIRADASPQQAVDKINNYYGMPDRTVDPRAGVAQAMLGRQNGDQAPPVMAFDGQAPATPAATPTMQVAQAPQGQPAPVPGYVTPDPGAPSGPRILPPSSRELQLQQHVSRLSMSNPYAAQGPAAQELAILQANRKAAQDVENERFKSNLMIQRDQLNKSAEQRGSQIERMNANLKDQEAIKKARLENKVIADFGGLPPQQVFEKMDNSAKEANLAKKGLQAANDARQAILGGAILGAGADMRLNIAKVVTSMGLKDMGNEAANTEVFRSAMAPVVAGVLTATVGHTQVSDQDRRFAADAAGGRINLEPTTIKRLIDITGRMSREAMEIHQARVDTLFGNNPAGKSLFGVSMPEVKKEDPLLSPAEKKQIDDAENWLLRNPRDPMAPAVRRKLGYQ